MRVALLGKSREGTALAAGMAAAGHTVVENPGVDSLSGYDAFILAVDEGGISRVTQALEPDLRRAHIVIHTCLSTGVQVLDNLETLGVVVAAISPVSGNRWVVSAADELGLTIAQLILGEMGAQGCEIPDAERGLLAAQVAYAKMTRSIALAAQEAVRGLLDEDNDGDPLIGGRGVMAAFPHIGDPSLRRAYLAAASRYAEIHGDPSLEMWALLEENR
ncbi:hypothetical protein CPHO_10685 [Corynebacterium phocae]|uniref:Uncharacterized protein n=2 Tax=Corynebacterium phocae TaxID=161895 RepID=A0A1L7D560_9CORY|nr:hypothetical protein CPHO_10685 [Corynebacterium phocae]